MQLAVIVDDVEPNGKRKQKSKLLMVSSDSRGTHAIQGFLDCLAKPQFYELVASIIVKETLKFAYNKHATHVLIKFLKVADVVPFLLPIYDVISLNFAELSKDANGLPVVKTSIQRFNLPAIKHKMISVLSQNTLLLS